MENEKKDIDNLQDEVGVNEDIDTNVGMEQESLSDKEVLESESDGMCSNGDENSQNEECEPALKIGLLEKTIKEKEDAYLRLNAEYSNYRRRTSEEKLTIGLFANEKIMSELIPIIDNMERALSAFDDKESSMYQGVDLVYKQLIDALAKQGLEEICPKMGDDFDHNFHMAVLQEPSEEFEAGKVTMVLQKGYSLGKKVLRAAMVKVSSW